MKLVFAVSALLLTIAAPVSLAETFTEDFTTTTFRDSVNTTADWNTADGELKLFPFQPSLVGSLGTQGTSRGVAMSGNLAFLADDVSGLRIIDISDPAAPVDIGSFITSAAAHAVAVSGNLAFVAVLTSGIQIVDISDPTAPTLVGSLDTPGFARGIAVDGGLAYVADTAAGLQIIDISDPAAPAIVGSFDTPGNAHGVAVSGNLAFIADLASGLQIIDISNAAAPFLVGSFLTPSSARGVAVAGDLAFVAAFSAGLQIIDITDPSTPAFVGSCDMPNNAFGVEVAGDLAFVAVSTSGLQVVDISDPAAPIIVESFDTTGASNGVAVAGEFAFVADGFSGFQIVRITNLTAPTLVGTVDTPGDFRGIALAGDLAYVGDFNFALKIIDITDPAAPTLVGNLDTPGRGGGVALAGDLALLAGGSSGLQIVDITDPTTPAIVGNIDTPGIALEVVVAGDLAFIADNNFGLQIVDITDPTAPFIVGTFDTPFLTLDLAVTGNLALLADTSTGLLIVDITDPAAPFLAGSFATEGSAQGVTVAGDLAFISELSSGIQIVDFSDPAAPFLIGNFSGVEFVRDVTVDGNLAIVADGNSGLKIFDITDPAAPALVGSIDTPGGALDVAVAGELAFVADNTTGLHVVQFAQHEFESLSNIGRSLAVDSADDTILQVSLVTIQNPDVSWEVSADNGTNWQPILPDNDWNAFAVPGSDLLWRSTHTMTAPTLNPSVSDLRLKWLTDAPAIYAITDVPNDQGGRVLVTIERSGFDFAAETTSPITQYGVYRRLDVTVAESVDWAPGKEDVEVSAVATAELPGEDVRIVDGVRYVVSTAKAAGTFPPGTWILLTSVPATQRDLYLAEVTTVADSSAAGPADAVFLVTAHTTTPSLWFASLPVSGHSVDNLAPGVPQWLAVQYVVGGVALSWAAAPEPDFQFFRVYRSSDPAFVPGPETLVFQTAATSWQDLYAGPGEDYYKVTALDHAGNESQPASAGLVSAVVEGTAEPKLFALRANHPNPFNPRTTISFDLPQAGPVELAIYDVTGRRVCTLLQESRSAGRYEVIWQGTNDEGRQVASGVYLYKLRAGSFVETRQMTLLK